MLDGINFKTIWWSLVHVVLSNNLIHIIWCAGILIFMIVLAVLHHKWKFDYGKKMLLWRFLCLIPLAAAGAHYMLYLKGCDTDIVSSFTPLYAIGVLALIPIPFANRTVGYRLTATLPGLICVLSGLVFAASSPQFYNYTDKSYSESFSAMVKTMERTYVLKDWKDADLAELEKKYMPLVKEAEKKNDALMFGEAVTQFCNELHDGHIVVQYDRSSEKDRDFGMGLVKLDNGDVIAVCTSAEANEKGIKDGTVITAWNGKPVLQAAEEDVKDDGSPVKANGDILSVIKLAVEGGATVEVSFIDEDGEEQTVTLYDLIDNEEDAKKHHCAMDAYNLFRHAPDKDTEKAENFSTKMLDDKCGYILVNEESTENGLHDLAGYFNGDHKWAREMFREKLKDLKSQGMEYLVIDLRNNEGGNDEIGFALVDLLTKDPQFGLNVGMRWKDGYKPLADHGIKGDGEFADLKVVALTNFNCGSAGDSLAQALGNLPNVTLMGMTDPNGCNQETGGMMKLAGGDVTVYYPTGIVLDEKGEPNIDTKADRISRDPVEERIPLDHDAAMKLFVDKEDYELSKATEFLKGQ